jgi:transposase
MARYKHYDYSQTKMLPVSYERQILPGTFEHTLSYLIDNKIDLSVFADRYRNDDGGAPAYDPAILLKIILFAYSKGIIYSRKIEALCKESVVCMALSADATPHYTTIADFVSSLSGEITRIFRDVLLVCDEAGLIGKEMFAVDGVKLPSNASKEWSGKKADLKKKRDKIQRGIEHLIKKHRESDLTDDDASMNAAREKQVATLQKAVDKIERFLSNHGEKFGRSGKTVQSNITDNESAKMPTSKGVVQGYNGLAMVDAQAQVIVHAEAHGEGQEGGLLQPMIEGTNATFQELDLSEDITEEVKLTADAGYSSEANAKYLFENSIDAYVADNYYRKRDPRFKDAERHKPTRPDEPFAKPKPEKVLFKNTDFKLADDHETCTCPAGKQLNCCAKLDTPDGYSAIRFRALRETCRDCPLRAQCIRHPERTPSRQVAFFLGRAKDAPEKYMDKMKRKIDSDHGRYQYSRRLGTVEPVFANIRHTHRLNRFSLRTRKKVNTQWLLFCLVHNIGKVQRHGSRVMTTRARSKARMMKGKRKTA